ncbi:hypothetical protein T03_3007 [Trichinella britovi]|uniref:Uncharacterized protein n=1 Tax=Trichinella britovi TaxID=45882 RepID=A0A0V0YT11_TRIBR|nr:hypothetical protein T03_3007 [Trichinella britovi]
MTNGHRAVILWQEYVDVILSKLSTPPLYQNILVLFWEV